MEIKKYFIKLFHLVGILHYAYAIYYDYVVVFPEEVKFRKYSFGGKFIYLTFWNTCLQMVYFGIALLNDFIGSNDVMIKNQPLTRKIRDYIFSSLAFPIAFDVGIMFWSLFTIDRDTVAPKEWDSIFPIWLNHFIHTDIMIFMVAEMIILHRKYPKIKSSLIGLSVFMTSYIFWIHVVNYNTGHWVYPILAQLDWIERIGFHLLNVSIPVALYFFGRFLNNRIWNDKKVENKIQEQDFE